MVSSQLIVKVKYEKSLTNCQPTTPPLVRPELNYGFGRQGSCSLAIVRSGDPCSCQRASIASLSPPSVRFNVVRHSQSRSNLFDRVDDDGHTSCRPPCRLWPNTLGHTGPARCGPCLSRGTVDGLE